MASRDYSIALDISLSMGEPFSDMIPSKLHAAREAVAALASRATARGYRVAITLFHEKPVPLLPPTSDYKTIVRALADVGFTGEGSALGDGIVEAVKMLRGCRGEKVVVAVTDGGVTEGVPVRAAVLYAKYSGARLHIVLLNRRVEDSLRQEVELANHPGAEIVVAESRQKLLAELLRLI